MGYSFSPHIKGKKLFKRIRFTSVSLPKLPKLKKTARKIVLADFNLSSRYLPNHIYFVVLRAKARAFFRKLPRQISYIFYESLWALKRRKRLIALICLVGFFGLSLSWAWVKKT